MMSVRVVLTLSMSATCWAPSAPSLLPRRLRARKCAKGERCQRLLAFGNTLDGSEGRVCLEEVRDDLGTFHLQAIVAEAGNERRIAVSAAADTFVSCTRSTPQRCERRIMLEGSCQGSWALRCRNELLLPILVLFLIAANVVAIQTVPNE